jgi:hypothetical protein
MATVEIVKSEKQVDNDLEVTIDARTSVGRIDIPLRFEDQGSQERNETRAFAQAPVIVEGIASAHRLRLGPHPQFPPMRLEGI